MRKTLLAGSIITILVLAVVSLQAAKSKPSAPREDIQKSGEQTYKCVPRPTRAAPPARLAPTYRSRGQNTQKEYRPIAMKPLCPEGQAAVSAARPFPRGLPKGNPLIGPIRDKKAFDQNPGAVIRKSLRPFKEVYSKGRGQLRHHSIFSSLASPPPACDGIEAFASCYYYASAAFVRTADGGGMTTSIERPMYFTTGGGGHSLDEIALHQKADEDDPGNGNIIELGWNLSSEQYGDSDPHLFVFHWQNWVPTCYDGCGWQQYSGTYYPGMNLSAMVGRHVYIGYVYYEGNWWAWFDNQWLGYFPGSEWGGTYTTSELIQWFGEVSSSNGIPPRTDMGNGLFPADEAAATNYTLCDVDATAWVCWYRDQQVLGATVPGYYDIARTGFGQVRYGGPGE